MFYCKFRKFQVRPTTIIFKDRLFPLPIEIVFIGIPSITLGNRFSHVYITTFHSLKNTNKHRLDFSKRNYLMSRYKPNL